MSVIEDIKQKIDIVAFISEYVKLFRAGRNYRALCPFHSEKTPSFFVFPEQGTWHCFGSCGTGGDIYSFIMKKEGLDFGQALRLLADRLGIILDQPESKDKDEQRYRGLILEINEVTANYFHELLLNSSVATDSRQYLQLRGINDSMIKKFVLGYCKDSYNDLNNYLTGKGYQAIDMLAAGVIIKRDDGSLCDRFRNRLIFPIWDIAGKVIGFGARSLDGSMPKYTNSPQTMVFDKSSCLYAIHKARDSIRSRNQVIVTEGYMDVISSHQYAWENTVATMGTALTEKHLTIIRKYTKNLVLALDSDEAGMEASLRIAESIDIENYLDSDVRVVLTPQGKDPDEVIRLDPEAWGEAVGQAELLIDYAVKIIRKKYDLSSPNGKSLAIDKFLPMVSKVKDPARRGEYIKRFATAINVDEQEITSIIRMSKKVSPSKMQHSMESWKEYIVSPNFGKLEDETLGLLLQHPELRPEAESLSQDYFEKRESLEIFAKWLKYEDIDSVRSNLDPLLHPHLDNLLQMQYPPLGGSERIKKIYHSYASRLREKYHRNMLYREAAILDAKMNAEGELSEGVDHAESLKEIYQERIKRR